jgi:solute carrier family 13 (sodium-dependent dicarboxylate transporter), member 2/3/5
LPNDDKIPAEPAEAISGLEAAFERRRRAAGVVLAPLAFAAVYLTAAGLGPQGQLMASILSAVVVLWICETLPLPVTALLGAVLCIALGVAPARQVFSYFADPIVFLFIGSFMLARAMSVHGLDRRMALSFLSIRWVSASPARLLAGLGFVTAGISMWVSNTATTAMMLPIALGILGALHRTRATGDSDTLGARPWPFATGMMLMVSYAACIGGIGTPVGSPPNLIGIGMIRNSVGIDIAFLTWMALAVPMLIAMAVALFLLLYRLHPETPPPGRASANSAHAVGATSALGSDMRAHVEREKERLGPWTRGQANTLVAFGVAVALWMLPGVFSVFGLGDSALSNWLEMRMPEAVVAVVAALLLFVLPVRLREGEFTLTWAEAVKIDWGTILLFGGGLTLGTLMFETGVAQAVGEAFADQLGASSLWGFTFTAIIVGIVLSETTSNTAAANMVIPVVIAIAQAADINPVPPALGAVFGASFGFMLPVSTPPNAIVYGSGLIPIPKMMRAGIVFDVLGLFIIWIGLRIMCPLLGLA